MRSSRRSRTAWELATDVLEYTPLGFGSYHWVATDAAGGRRFVTVDDLDRGPLDTRDAAFGRLERAFDTTLALRTAGGLSFVVAPLPTRHGQSVRRIGPRHSIAVHPFVDGQAGAFDDPTDTPDRDVVPLLVDLHRTTDLAANRRSRGEITVPGRQHIESALGHRDVHWDRGPFGEAARDWVTEHSAELTRLLDAFDRLATRVNAAEDGFVITHGEPHAGNTIATHEGLVLVDWDTVGLAPPERDLWMLAAKSGDALDRYADGSGHQPDAAALDLYRLAWDLSDVAAYLGLFQSPHPRSEDTEQSWLVLSQKVLR